MSSYSRRLLRDFLIRGGGGGGTDTTADAVARRGGEDVVVDDDDDERDRAVQTNAFDRSPRSMLREGKSSSGKLRLLSISPAGNGEEYSESMQVSMLVEGGGESLMIPQLGGGGGGGCIYTVGSVDYFVRDETGECAASAEAEMAAAGGGKGGKGGRWICG